MYSDQLPEYWEWLRDRVGRRWRRLTDDDLDEIEGDAEVLSYKLQEVYGCTAEKAEAEIERFLDVAEETRLDQATLLHE